MYKKCEGCRLPSAVRERGDGEREHGHQLDRLTSGRLSRYSTVLL
jgi:hypothetical protein